MKANLRNIGALAIGLFVSLGFKAIVEQPVDYGHLTTSLLDVARQALTEKDFTILAQTDIRAIQAFKSGCFITLGYSLAEGGGDASFIANYGGSGRVIYWYRGQLYDQRPGALGLIDRYFVRLEQIFSGSTNLHPIYHIVASDQCSDVDIRSLALDNVGRGAR